MDEIDRRILNALEENARARFTELARKVGLSPAAVTERVRRMEEEGVIAGYHAILNASKIGWDVHAYVSVKAPQEQIGEVIALARTTPEVKQAHRIAGANTFLLRVVARTESDLERIMQELGRLGTTEAAVVVSTPVEKFTT
jgi:Lrp/AsnC family transcriptional regulator, leucine-responsive regulatory protein